MKKIFLVSLFCSLFVFSIHAQSSSVTLQVTDAGGQTWNNGTWSVLLVSQPGATNFGPPFNLTTGGSVPNQSQSGVLSGTGGASITLSQNSFITPTQSRWQFTVCPAQGIPFQCYTQSVTIAGASPTVTLAPPVISVSCGSNVSAYTDAEVICGVGGQYYNLTSSANRQCAVAVGSVCTTWTGAGDFSNLDYYGHQFPQSWQAKNAELRYASISSVKIALIGDSELRNAAISDGLASYLEWVLGNSGSGWINAATATVTWNGTVSTTTGTWVDAALTANTWGPSISETNSSDIATPATKVFTGNMTSANILYKIQPGGGTFTWSVDGGGTTPVSTAGTLGLGTTNIPGLTLGSHVITLTVTVAGTAGVTLFGADTFLTTRGVQVSDISATGSTTTSWTQQNMTLWKSGITSLNPDITFIALLGTNDSNQNIPVATYTANLITLVQALQSVNPLMDIVLVSCQDNGVWTTISPAMYNVAVASVARTMGVGYIDGYSSVGLYASANTRGLMANTTHLNQYGGQVYIDRILEFIMPPVTPAFVPSSQHNTFLAGGGNLTAVGSFSSAVGQNSLIGLTTGGYDTCYGYATCGALTTNSYNTGVGTQALANAASDGNTAVGQGAGINESSGGFITAIGQNSCGTATTDSFITCIGRTADVGAATGITNATSIGSGAVVSASNRVVLGNGSVTDVYSGSETGAAKEHAASFQTATGAVSGVWNCVNVTPVTTSGGSTTNDQNTLACTIPAGTLNLVGKTLSIRYKGLYTTNAANLSTINLKIKICSVSGCASGNVLTLANITSAANAGGVANFAMGYVGDATTQTAAAALAEESHGLYTIDIAATNVLPETIYSDTNIATVTGTPSNIDSTAQNFLQISCAFSIASASNTCQGRQLVVESIQ